MHRTLRALDLTKGRREIILRLILKTLRTGLYSLHLALLIYIGITYTLICLYLTSIRLLIRLSATGLLLKILTIIRILLLTSCIAALFCLGSTYLQIYLIAQTFGPNISGRYKVAAIYIQLLIEFNSPKARSVIQ